MPCFVIHHQYIRSLYILDHIYHFFFLLKNFYTMITNPYNLKKNNCQKYKNKILQHYFSYHQVFHLSQFLRCIYIIKREYVKSNFILLVSMFFLLVIQKSSISITYPYFFLPYILSFDKYDIIRYHVAYRMMYEFDRFQVINKLISFSHIYLATIKWF